MKKSKLSQTIEVEQKTSTKKFAAKLSQANAGRFSRCSLCSLWLFKLLVISLMIWLVTGYGLAADKKTNIDRFLNACYNRGLLNGVVLVVENDSVIYKKAFGPADSAWDIANRVDTKFYLYSMTQQFTAALILKLAEEGKLKTDGVIRDYLPYYREDTGKKITIHHLLTHTHGIPDVEYRQLPLVNPFPVKDFVSKFLSKDLEFAPGSRVKVSYITGYTLLGAIIEQVTGKKYEQVLKEKILDPLKMKNSGFIPFDTVVKKLATPYHETPNDKKSIFFRFRCNGGSSMYASVDDLLLWHKALNGTALLTDKSKESMFTGFVPAAGSGSYGYGWNIVNLTSEKVKKQVAWHVGEGSVAIWRIIDDNHLIIILGNIVSPRIVEICTSLSNLLYNRPGILPKRSFISALNKIIAKKGVPAGVEEYKRLRKNFFNEYDFSESQLNTLGNYLISTNRLNEAVEIFKLNLDYFPDSWFIYTRLGETFIRGKQKEMAIKCYEAAVKLIPRGEEQAYKEIEAILQQIKAQPKPKPTEL